MSRVLLTFVQRRGTLRTSSIRRLAAVRAYRLLTRFGIGPPDTIEFQLPELDRDGNLILDLRTVKISPKAHSQCRGKDKRAK